MQNILTLLVTVVASLLRSMEFLAIGALDYEQLVQFSNPLVQLAVVSSVLIGTETGFMGGVAVFVVFLLLTVVWTVSLGSIGF